MFAMVVICQTVNYAYAVSYKIAIVKSHQCHLLIEEPCLSTELKVRLHIIIV